MKKGREKPEPDLSSLLVFGYACKLFRDDEKAASIDAGKHLIPWMGDTNLRIDRYDGRGHLHNLTQYEAKNVVEEKMGELERHEEELVDEERWRSLVEDDSKLDLETEEEIKREQNTAQIGFNYENMEPGAETGGTTFGPEYNQAEAEEDEPYTAGSELMLPPGMKCPPTLKLFRAIEKTALFLADQGVQMEIWLKAKQAGNPVFDFLSVDCNLHPFYRHLIKLVKTKQYKSSRQSSPPNGSAGPTSLQPTMASYTPKVTVPKPVPNLPFKPSEDCAYSQLMKRLRPNIPLHTVNPAPAPAPSPAITTAPPTAAHTAVLTQAQPPPPPSDSPPAQPTVTPPSSVPSTPSSGPIIIPPPDLQPVIDKMASYVAKNGRSFEDVVKARPGCQEKFSFLTTEDRHHNYYLHKLAIYTTGNFDAALASAEPLVFKVKKTEEKKETTKSLTNALIQYGNSDEEKEDEAEDKASDNEDEEKGGKKKSSFPNLVGFLPAIAAKPQIYQEEEDLNEVKKKEEEERREKRKKEEEERRRQEETNKLRDKLAAKAREKMVQAAKEKALQLERKRKAASFLAQLAERKTTVSSATPVSGGGGDSSEAEEGELKEVGGTTTGHSVDSSTPCNIWPPPAPPQLVVPTRLGDPNSAPPAGYADPVVDLSSGDEDRKKKKRKRRRSRSRDERKSKRKRSRSKHRKHRKARRHRSSSRSSSSEEEVRSRRRKRKRSRSSSGERGRGKKRIEDSSPEIIAVHSEAESSPSKDNVGSGPPVSEAVLPPTVAKMTEDLRAKVRAMLNT